MSRGKKRKLKKVVLVYDNLLHKPKLHNLTSFENANKYEYEDIFITEYKDIYNVFVKSVPDIYIINASFNNYEIIERIKNMSNIMKENLKLIVISSDSEFRDMLYKSKIPDRIFSENVASDVLEATIIELANIHIFSNKFLYVELINKFELKPYSPTTEHFFKSLQIAGSNPFLLSGHINNIYYSISKEFNISTEAARKSIYRVIESARRSSNDDYICSIFGNNTLNDMSPSRFLENITWKFRDDKR